MKTRSSHPPLDPAALMRVLAASSARIDTVVRDSCGEGITQDEVDAARAAAAEVAMATQALSKTSKGALDAERAVGATRWHLRKWLPRLKDRIVADLPAPGERERTRHPGKLPLRFSLYLMVLKSGLVPSAEARAAEQALSEGITHAAVFYQRWLTEHLLLKDPVDVRAVSFDQLRMEILLWLLEELGDRNAAANVRTQSRVTARAALRRAQAIVEDYVARRGPAERFDVATIVAQVEELALLIERISAFTLEEECGNWRLAEGNREQVHAFAHSCGKLVLATFRDIQERLFDARLGAKALGGALKQVEAVRALLLRIDTEDDIILLAVERIISRKVDLLVRLLAQHDEIDPQMRREMLDELAALLERLKIQPAAKATADGMSS